MEKGRTGEQLAADYLRRHGYDIVHVNWRIRTGELDIVAKKPGLIVFAEVRARHSNRFGTAKESVDGKKQAKIRRTAEVYLQRNGWAEETVRFDVLAVEHSGGAYRIEHIPDAF